MAITHNLGITLLEQAQAQKEVTINQAIAVLDAAFNPSVLDKDLATPPASPTAGDSYLIASAPAGAWAGKANYVTYYDSGWRFIAPKEGLTIWVADETAEYRYSGSAWAIASGGGGGSGDVVGPASSVDNTLARFDGTTGKLIQGSTVTVADTGALAVTSGSPIAFAVGANGATNPALTVDASTASSATGVAIKSAASGGGVTITASSSATNESLTLACKGFAGLNLNGGTGFVNIQSGTVAINSTGLAQFAYSFRGYTSNTAYSFIGLADSNLTAGAECLSLDFNFAQTKTHSAGAIAIQRDVRFRPSTHAFAGASIITTAAGVYIDGAPIAGTNASITESATLYLGR
jgi:hypothetical protein